jgi:hypothetical protein
MSKQQPLCVGILPVSKPLIVSDALYARLEQAAQARGMTVEQLLTDLSGALPPPPHAAQLRALSSGGLAPASLGAFADWIDPATDYEAIRRALARKQFSPSLSETIIAERG